MSTFTPFEAIRKHCLMCFQNSLAGIRECADTLCPLWPYRLGTRPDGLPHRPLKACRRFCVEQCLAGEASEVKSCQGDKAVLGPCPLYRFRMGRNPNISEATRAKQRETALRQQRVPPNKRNPQGVSACQNNETLAP